MTNAYKDGLNGIYNNPHPNPEPSKYAEFMEYHNDNQQGQWHRRTATQLMERLKALNYHVTIPTGDDKIHIMGMNKGYFAAKEAKAKTITSQLIAHNFQAYCQKSYDGYWDIYVKIPTEIEPPVNVDADANPNQ